MAVDTDRYVLQRADGETLATLPTTRRESLLDCLLRHRRPIRTVCRGSLICGQCRVEVVEGLDALPPPNRFEAELLQRFAPGEPRTRLACQVVVPEGLHEIVVRTSYL